MLLIHVTAFVSEDLTDLQRDKLELTEDQQPFSGNVVSITPIITDGELGEEGECRNKFRCLVANVVRAWVTEVEDGESRKVFDEQLAARIFDHPALLTTYRLRITGYRAAASPIP